MNKNVISFCLFCFLFFFTRVLLSQNNDSLRIAYVNSDYILEVMPEKEKARVKILDLNNGYKSELQIMQNDYNKKYSSFISNQTAMPENIRLRRMQELYELEKKMNEFAKISQDDVLNQEQQLINPLRAKIKTAISEVGTEKGYQVIYDVANPAILFVTPDAVDITELVLKRLNIKN